MSFTGLVIMKMSSCGFDLVAFALLLGLVACSKGSGNTGNSGGGSGGGTGGTPATSGEYLLEFPNTGTNLSYATINTTTGALSATSVAGGPFFSEGDYPAVVMPPSDKFLYALYTTNTALVTFQIEGPGIQLGMAPSGFLVFTQPISSISLDPSGKHLYMIQSPGIIQEFSADAASGALTEGSTITETNADLRVGVIDATGEYLYVNDLSGGRIFAYQINQTSGALTAVTGSPFKLPANGQPTFPVAGGGGEFLYTNLYAGGIAAFAINTSSGALTVVPGSPFATTSVPGSLCADPSGRFLYATDSNSNSNGLVDGFAINATTGALTPVPSSPFATGQYPGSIAIDASGKFVYVSNYQSSSIYGYALNSNTGSLSGLAGSPFASIPNSVGVAAIQIP